ncbi:MAG TPA: hypothetical protein VGF80_14100 [Galbitalea sp.]
MTIRRLRLALVVAAVATVALAGCAPAAGTPAPHSTAVTKKHPPVHHTAVPTLDTTPPAARVPSPCSSLITPAELTAWQGSAVTALAPSAVATGDLADPSMQLPVADYVRAAGGLDCLWAAGPFDHYNPDPSAVPSYLEITVQFNATAEYNENAASVGASNGRAGECDVDDPGSICQIDDLVGTAWIEIYSRKAVGTGTGSEGISTIENSVLAAVSAAGTPAGLPETQAGTTPLGTSCTSFVSIAAVQAAVGSGALTAATIPQQQSYGSALSTPVWLPSQDALKDQPCAFSSGATRQATISWIPGGAWAWNENRSQTLAEAPLQSLTIAGQQAGDSAAIRCSSTETTCTVDLELGGNWIEATVPASSTAANKRTAATKLASDIVGMLG